MQSFNLPIGKDLDFSIRQDGTALFNPRDEGRRPLLLTREETRGLIALLHGSALNLLQEMDELEENERKQTP